MSFQPDAGVIQWRMHFASPPEKVFAALATDHGRAQYWAESAIEKHGVITFEFVSYAPFAGRVLRCDAPKRFAVEYFGSVTEFSLHSDGAGGTDLLLTASGVEETMRWEMTAGWVSVLMAMKAAVDHGVDLRNHDPKRTWTAGYADN